MTTKDRQKELRVALNNFYKNPVAKVSLELILSIGFVLILAIFVVKPTLTTMSELSREIEVKSKLNDDLNKKIIALRTAQDQLELLAPKLSLLDEAIPASATVIYNMKLIEKIASDNNVILVSAGMQQIPDETDESNNMAEWSSENSPNLSEDSNIQDESSSDNQAGLSSNSETEQSSTASKKNQDLDINASRINLPAVISVTGDYQSIRAMIEQLQNSRRSVNIDTIQFSIDQQRGSKNLKANATIAFPYLSTKE